jgi:hypothetical protein
MPELAAERALSWIRKEFGDLDDLHRDVIAVIWVTTYRAMEIGSTVGGQGPLGMVADRLKGGDLMLRCHPVRGDPNNRDHITMKIIQITKFFSYP